MRQKILVLGASGMLGSAIFRVFMDDASYIVYGTVRHGKAKEDFPHEYQKQVIDSVDVEDFDSLLRTLTSIEPDIVINCVGLVKQLEEASIPIKAITINSLLPHKLAMFCETIGARMIHISTDCVFSGRNGFYNEQDFPDASDLYGRTKLLGEVYYRHTITLRTSIIGHELGGRSRALLEWFLSQGKECYGYKNAIFSGFPTVILAKIIRDYVIPNEELSGLFHLASEPINKFDLLNIIADVYGKKITIIPEYSVKIDRSLNASLFNSITGFSPPSWREMIEEMKKMKIGRGT